MKGMNQTALSLLHGLLNEMENGIYSVIFFVKYLKSCKFYILLLFIPIYGEILDSKSLPEIGNDFRHCIDDVSNFIADDKLDVLR
jgi:hypothetical protein